MRIRLKGINPVPKRLADGTWVTYWYAWKSGPRVFGAPGTPEFMASYNAAVATKTKAPDGILQTELDGFQRSQKFLSKAPRTRADYARQIRIIERDFADLPLSVMTDPKTVGLFTDWRDRLALKSVRQADYAWVVLAMVLAWSKKRGNIAKNPCEKGGRIDHGTRVEIVWEEPEIDRFLSVAPATLILPMLLAIWTGQRKGDLLRLPWSAYDGKVIRLKQSKTGTPVVIKIGAPLKAALDATPRRSPIILVSSKGVPWNEGGFDGEWKKARTKAGIPAGKTFNDLRGTAVTHLALAGCSEAEIVTLTGHKLNDVRSILDAHYLNRDQRLGDSAIAKLEEYRK